MSKDEVIAALQRNIDRIQKQLDQIVRFGGEQGRAFELFQEKRKLEAIHDRLEND